MSTLRIVDAPLLPDVNGTEKVPTGGRGDYAISIDQIKDHIFQDVGKELVGLGNVDNTSDLDKPVSNATQAALNLKADKTYVDLNLDLKADKTNVYTRSETSLALSRKADLVNGVVPESQIPSSFNDVLEFTTPNLPIIGESGKIYITTDTNKTWRWATNRYVEISGWNPDSVSKRVTIPTYNNAAEGVDPVTGVVDGSYYNVRSTDDDTMLIEYQNVGGSAVVTGKSYPSGRYVETIAEYTALPFKVGESYTLYERVQLENGDIVRSTVANNTTNPNSNMVGWEFEGVSKSIYNPLNLNYTQQQLATAFTTSLNSLIQKVSLSGGGTISIPDGQFPIDVTVGITLLDDIALRFGKNTILKALAHNSPQHEILRIHDVNNVTISGGGVIDGNKSQNSATTGEWGMAVSIRAADNVNISDLKTVNTWGDGFYVGRTPNRSFSSRVTLNRVSSDSTRRNGLSVISVKELDVNDSSFDNSIEMEPKCGVDIEPNYADEFIQGVRFKNLKTSGNNIGLNIFLGGLGSSESIVTIDVDGFTDRNSRRESLANRNYQPNLIGRVKISDIICINETQSIGSMLALYSIAKKGLRFQLENVALASAITDVDIPYARIGRFDTGITGAEMGGIEIDGISAKTLNANLPTNAILLSALEATSKLDGVSIKNIGRLDAVNPVRSAFRVSNLYLESSSGQLVQDLSTSPYTLSTANLKTLYNNATASTITLVLPNSLPSGFEFEIRNSGTGGIAINIETVVLVDNPLGGASSLRCSTSGGFIKFKSLGNGVLKYLGSYGYTQDGATASAAQGAVSVPANSQLLLKSINLTGITTSDPVAVSYSVPASGLNIWAACEVNGSVNVYAVNHTAATISLPAGTIKVNRL